MSVELHAVMDLHPGQINLGFTWSAPGPRPDLRLARRQQSYPLQPEDGRLILALRDWFAPSGDAWAKSIGFRYLLPNAPREGGLVQSEVAYSFTAANAVVPNQVVITIYDAANQAMQETRLGDVTRLVENDAPALPWAQVHTVEIFSAPGGGPEVSAGKFVISSGNSDPTIPDQFAWLDPLLPAITVPFDQVQQQEMASTTLIKTGDTLRLQIDHSLDGQPGPLALLDEAFDPDKGEFRRQVSLAERGLQAETIYYYTLFSPDPANPGQWLDGPAQQASALTGKDYSLGQRLYQLLPEVHRRYDEPEPADRNSGALRRYLEIFGAGLDQMRSLAEGLRPRHDLAAARGDLLPELARWVGWEPDQTLDVATQRNDILHAPQIFDTVGASPNLHALINRVTGWDCQVKEFVHNVFLTNAPETVIPWELWGQSQAINLQWGAAAAITIGEGFDGRPAGATVPGNKDWLFFHAERAGRREIWLTRLDIANAPLKRAAQGLLDDDPAAIYHDENPSVVSDPVNSLAWLFWDSDRGGQWEIYTRAYKVQMNGSFLRGQPIQKLTSHPAEDRFPAAVLLSPGKFWAFWQSNRRGPTDIWGMQGDGTTWDAPQRVTTAVFRDETPAAVVDGAGQVWLFWSADLGDRRNLWGQVFNGVWSPPQALTNGPFRDESPTAVFWNNQVWLFWHSNRGGRWQVWASFNNGVAWQPPFPLVTSPADEKEPGALVDSTGTLRLLWRSQRRPIQYRSRTVDFDDPQALQAIGALPDHMHYSYDTGKENSNWYARDTVGLFLKPDIIDPLEIAQQMERVQAFIEPFRPLPVRFVWMSI